ncbi:hypothetical protein [Paractinoplanes maris]|uniref:hypothetical protein n=1 Tax=Paractinoplanes maris TaxID=1734446 RepID=UPI002020E36B|nr:hypothetical protein [Actinoplanes maris]
MRRLAGAALILLLTVLTAPAAAQAAPSWQMQVKQVSIAPGSVEEGLPFSVTPPRVRGTRYQYDLVFDITAAAGLVKLRPNINPRCVTTATTLTCPETGLDMSSYLLVTAEADAPVGTVVRIPGRVVTGGRTVASATGTITIAEEVALTAVESQGDLSMATGSTAGLAAGIRNTGDVPVNGIVLELKSITGIETAGYRNCVNFEGPPGPVSPSSGATCLFDAVLEPGQEYRLATPWQITATDAVWAPSEWLSQFFWYTVQDYRDLGRRLPPGTGDGPELQLAGAAELPAGPAAAPQTELDVNANPDNNNDQWSLRVTGRNVSTFTVTGDTASGRVGQTVAVQASVLNNGPARVEGWGVGNSHLMVTVRPPAGTTVIKPGKGCTVFNVDAPSAPGVPWPPGADFDDGNYYCFTDIIRGNPYLPGKPVNFDFTLRLDKPGTLRGEIRTILGFGGGQATVVNQKDAIVVTATGPAAGSPGGDGDDGDDGGTGGGGGLPITGGNTATVALIGLALLAAGAAARFATRRR